MKDKRECGFGVLTSVCEGYFSKKIEVNWCNFVSYATSLKGIYDIYNKFFFTGCRIFCLQLIFTCLQMESLFALNSGDRIQVTSSIGVKVRESAGGASYPIGQTYSALGVISGNPLDARINGTGTLYTWWFVDFDSGQDGWVATVGFSAMVPSAPTLISPGDGSNVQNISTLSPVFNWNKVLGATGYGLYVEDASTRSLCYDNDFVGNVTSLTLPPGTLQPGKYYIWNMRASNSAGFGPFSKGSSGTFYFYTDSIPIPPNALVAQIDNQNHILLSWTYQSSNEDGFKIERKIGVNGSWFQIGTVAKISLGYTDSDVSSGVTYSYRVKAYNTIGDSDPSNDLTLTLLSNLNLAINSQYGTVTKNPDQLTYLPGTIVTLTPVPNSQYSFAGWAGDASGAGIPLKITMNSNKSITATFVPIPVAVTVGTSIGGPKDGFSPISLEVPQLHSSYRCIFQLSKDGLNWFSYDATAGSTAPVSWRVPKFTDSEMGLGRLQICVMQYEPPFLMFPIKGTSDPYKAEISAIYDHDMDKEGVMRTYRNEQATSTFRVVSSQSPSLIGFMKDKAGTPFDLKFNYNDGTGEKKYLWYDDHSGYDYPCDLNTEIIAAADGVIDISESRSQANWNGLCIIHNNGYRTYYLHLTRWADNIVHDFNLSGPILVHQGDTIGYAGNYGVDGATSPNEYVHLHLSVKDQNKERVDPYGEFVLKQKNPIKSVLWLVSPQQ
jgi:hypothetical protein